MREHEIVNRVKCVDGFFYRCDGGVCRGCGKKLRVVEE